MRSVLKSFVALFAAREKMWNLSMSLRIRSVYSGSWSEEVLELDVKKEE